MDWMTPYCEDVDLAQIDKIRVRQVEFLDPDDVNINVYGCFGKKLAVPEHKHCIELNINSHVAQKFHPQVSIQKKRAYRITKRRVLEYSQKDNS